MFAAAFIANALTGGLKFGFEGQPVAHSDFLWNYLGMVTAGLAFAPVSYTHLDVYKRQGLGLAACTPPNAAQVP